MGGKVYKMFPVETIRGCPYTCKFCNSPDQMALYNKETDGGYFRKKKIDLVSKELKHFKNDLGVEYNYFWADTFLAMNKKEFEEFCEMYSEIKIWSHWAIALMLEQTAKINRVLFLIIMEQI